MTKKIVHVSEIKPISRKLQRIFESGLSWQIRYGTLLLIIFFIVITIMLAYLPYPHGHGESILSHFISK